MSDEAEVRRQSIDPDRLLPGEDLDSQDRQDAEHWVAVYTELLNTKQKLIRNLREMMAQQAADVRDELERADIRMLEMQIDRFVARRTHWQRRLGELPAAGEGTG